MTISELSHVLKHNFDKDKHAVDEEKPWEYTYFQGSAGSDNLQCGIGDDAKWKKSKFSDTEDGLLLRSLAIRPAKWQLKEK